MYDLNIVIVNYKTRDDVEICLSSVFRDLANSDLNVVVHLMDNSENVDGVKNMLADKFPQVVYIDNGGNIGFGASQNIGLKKEQARYYLVLNPDVEFIEGENVLEEKIKYMEENPEVGIAAPKTYNADGTVQLSCSRNFNFFDQVARRVKLDERSKHFRKKIDRYLMRDFDHNETVDVDWLIGSFLFIRPEVFRDIGYFDDRYFMYFEDCDLCRRAWEAGHKVRYVHHLGIKHKHKRDSAEANALSSIFTNRVTRIHLKSWLKYFIKWGLKRKHFGK
ncbi:hypothetical protein C0584_01885 [Candidatus Parcubacteria bacterium]|nr:MAG: hypothetical protein C0584_01885 [Candidatus Parcubacteria bacterium]